MDWTEKYRPSTEDGYVFPRGKEGKMMRRMLHASAPENIILYGKPGCGKTTFARLYANTFGVPAKSSAFYEFLGTELHGVADVRDKLIPVVSYPSWEGEYKFIHMEECDHLSDVAVSELKIHMEGNPLCVFMLTTNNLSSIDAALKSRSACVHCSLDKVDVLRHVAFILKAEAVQYNLSDIEELIETTIKDHGIDMRAIIKNLERNYR